MDRSTSSNIRLFGMPDGASGNNRGDFENVGNSLSNGSTIDKQSNAINHDGDDDDANRLMFEIEMPLTDDDMTESTAYYDNDTEVAWIVSRKDADDDDDRVSHQCDDCGSVHFKNVECPTPEYSDNPTAYDTWTLRPTTPSPLPSRSEFFAGAAKSPQDMDTSTTTTTTTNDDDDDDIPKHMPPKVKSIVKEMLNGQSYTDFKNSAKAKLKELYQTRAARELMNPIPVPRCGTARDLAIIDADRRRRERLEREEAFEQRRYNADRRRLERERVEREVAYERRAAQEEGDEHRRRRRRRRNQYAAWS